MPHPLAAYLARNHEAPNAFAKRVGMARQIVYDMLAEQARDYRISSLLAIETATKGEVTVAMQVDWWIGVMRRADYDDMKDTVAPYIDALGLKLPKRPE